MKFEHLGLIAPILKAAAQQGYTIPTPIQEQAIPVVLEGRDLLGCAQTGTGKTAAFAMPILQLLYREKEEEQKHPARPQLLQPIFSRQRETRTDKNKRPLRVLVMTPTRELAVQIDDSFADYGIHTGLKHTVIFGGVSQNPQTKALQNGVDILVATPGRLLDLIGQRFLDLDSIEIFVLDEADRMLDMGFAHDMKKVIAMLPVKRQTLMFSATMPDEIKTLVNTILKDPVRIEVTPAASTVDLIDQSVYLVEKKDKKHLLNLLLEDPSIESALIFTRTKHGADKVVKDLQGAGTAAQAIHGNKSQTARQLALNNFKSRETRVLVATDIAARGIDVHELTHVINYDLPNIPETYVHRIGRTGRAGLVGTAISFCDFEEREYLRDIQKLIAKKIPIIREHPYESTMTEAEYRVLAAEQPKTQTRPQRQQSAQNRPQRQQSEQTRPQRQQSVQNRPQRQQSEQNRPPRNPSVRMPDQARLPIEATGSGNRGEASGNRNESSGNRSEMSGNRAEASGNRNRRYADFRRQGNSR